MAGPAFKFEVAGDVQMARGFSRFAESIKDLRPAFREIERSFREIERRQFQSEGSYGSGGWARLSPAYAEWKEAHFPGKPILQLTGALMGSLVGKTSKSVIEMEKLSLAIGTRLEYAIYHQKGTPRMPARPIIKLTGEDKRQWTKILHRFLVNQAKKAGLKR